MYSFLTTLLILSRTYPIVHAAKVIKWPTNENEPTEVVEATVNQPSGVVAEAVELNNTENVETFTKQSEQENAAIKFDKSQPKCLTDFVGTLIYDLMQNENGRIVMSKFLNALTHTVSNSVSSSMYLHISRQLKNLFKDSEGSKSISIISNTFMRLFTDERAFKNLNIVVENFKMTFIRSETTLLINNINELATSLSTRPRSRRIIRAFGDGILSLLKLPNPKDTIIKGFQDLHSYTWPDVDTSQNSVVNWA